MKMRLLLGASSLGCGLVLGAGAAFAQGLGDNDLERIVAVSGATRAEDYLNSMPWTVPAQGAGVLNTADGTAQVDLRGLGPERTLVLINGRRLPYGSSLSAVPDLNQIPLALIERVDMLTGGASAMYGSDAISGVINFVTIKEFDGVRIDGQIGGFNHSNNSDDGRGILSARFPNDLPKKHVFDGESIDATVIMGTGTSDGRGDITAYAGYRNNQEILQGDRDFAACPYGGGAFSMASPFGFGCGPATATPNGVFFTPSGTFTLDETGPGDTFRPLNFATGGYNVAPPRSLQRADERYVFGGFAHYELSRHFDVYNETMYYNYRTDAQNTFPAAIFTTSSINCDNPFLSAQQGAIICGPSFGLPVFASLYPAKRFVEGAPRNDRFRAKNLRIVGGIRGKISGAWDYDAYFQYADGENSRRHENDISASRLVRALDVIDVGGVPTCRSAFLGTDASCIPLNLFQIGGVTPAALDYLQIPSLQEGDVKQYIGSMIVTGGIAPLTPWTDDDVGVAAGFEWRKDSVAHRPDALAQSGDLIGQGGATPPFAASMKTRDYFFEVDIPLVSDKTLAERMSINGAFRRTDPSIGDSYSTWKILGDWSVVKELRIRGGWQRAARTPNLVELFSPQIASIAFLVDPCAGFFPSATPAECANTGVSSGSYGAIPANPAGLANVRFGGDPDLDPEKSDTWTIGGAVTVGDFGLAVDYFDIVVADSIAPVSAFVTLDQCLTTGDPLFCSRIHRDGAGTLWLTGFIEATNGNAPKLSTSGLDIAAIWSLGLGRSGRLDLDFASTYVFDLTTHEIPGVPTSQYDCAGFYAGVCGSPKPEYRHKLRATWQAPAGFDASITWRKLSGVDQFGVADPDPSVDRNFHLDGRSYIDLAASFDLAKNVNVAFGVNNILDKDPPRTSIAADLANGNTFPQTYDSFGRFLYLGITVDLQRSDPSNRAPY